MTGNSDQFLEWDAEEFINRMLSNDNIDGVISTFIKKDPNVNWSYAKVNDEGIVTDVQEKKPISNFSTTGIYLWRKGSDFVTLAKQKIDAKDKSNNEYYVASVYNYAIRAGKEYVISHCKKIWGIDVPDDLNYFLKQYKGPLSTNPTP